MFYEVWTFFSVKNIVKSNKRGEIDTVVWTWTWVEGLVIRDGAHPIVILPVCQYPPLDCPD